MTTLEKLSMFIEKSPNQCERSIAGHLIIEAKAEIERLEKSDLILHGELDRLSWIVGPEDRENIDKVILEAFEARKQ